MKTFLSNAILPTRVNTSRTALCLVEVSNHLGCRTSWISISTDRLQMGISLEGQVLKECTGEMKCGEEVDLDFVYQVLSD